VNPFCGGDNKKSFGSAFGLYNELRVSLQNAPMPARFFCFGDFEFVARHVCARGIGPFTRYII